MTKTVALGHGLESEPLQISLDSPAVECPVIRAKALLPLNSSAESRLLIRPPIGQLVRIGIFSCLGREAGARVPVKETIST